MHKFLFNLRIGLLVLFFSLSFFNLDAAHYSAGEIYYRWAPTANDSLRYEVIVHWFWRSSINTNGTHDVCISSSCYGDTTISLNLISPPANLASPNDPSKWIAPPENDCGDPNDPAYSNYTLVRYGSFVSLPGKCGDYKFSVFGYCCRDASDNLGSSGSENIYLEATLNNTIRESSSPQITSSPNVLLCKTNPGDLATIFSQSAFDPEGDSIKYRLVPSRSGTLCGPSSDIAFLPGFTAYQSIPSYTGLSLDPQTGKFALNPSQQGNYNMNIIVEAWNFDPISLQWVLHGSSNREIIVTVTANCNSAYADGPQINASTNTFSSSYFSSQQIDSLLNTYNVAQIHRDSTLGANLGIYNIHQCFDTLIPLEFTNPIRTESILNTDFRIIGSDSVLRPVVEVIDSCTGDFCDKVYLRLHQPLVKNGNYLLQIKKGHDGNTLIGKCGSEMAEFTSLIIPVNDCPNPSYQLNQVTLKDDYNLMVHWTASPDLQDSSVYQFFGAWNIYVKENGGAWRLERQIKDPLSRRFEMDFGGSDYEVDHNFYEFKLALDYAGYTWDETRSCNNIVIEEVSSQSTLTADVINLSWNHYSCLPANRRDYYVQYGRYKGGIHPDWQMPQIVQGTTANISIPKTEGSGTYAIRVYARDGQQKLLPSESNWYLYEMSLDPIQIGSGQSSCIIPNVISPNGDGQNDRFFFIIPPADAGVQQIALRIYDRSGSLKFQDLAFQNNNTANLGWDGTDLNGNALGQGAYFYLISYTDPNTGAAVNLQGTVNLIR